jgi:hypothetical protein
MSAMHTLDGEEQAGQHLGLGNCPALHQVVLDDLMSPTSVEHQWAGTRYEINISSTENVIVALTRIMVACHNANLS